MCATMGGNQPPVKSSRLELDLDLELYPCIIVPGLSSLPYLRN